jgi:hypothetical protein
MVSSAVSLCVIAVQAEMWALVTVLILFSEAMEQIVLVPDPVRAGEVLT